MPISLLLNSGQVFQTFSGAFVTDLPLQLQCKENGRFPYMDDLVCAVPLVTTLSLGRELLLGRRFPPDHRQGQEIMK